MISTSLQLLPIAATPEEEVRPTWHHATVEEHRGLAGRYRHLRLHAPSIAAIARAGQFVMLTAAREEETAPVLPRPMAIYRRDPRAGIIDIIYAQVGTGTRRIAGFWPGERMLVTGPLGQGFRLALGTSRVLLVGRGIGTCSLTTVAQDCVSAGTEIIAVTSARDAALVIGGSLYREYGGRVYPVTDADGTSSVEALHAVLTVDLDDSPPQQIMTCGSERLARLCRDLGDRWDADVQVSLEAHMACGLGYCHGCATGARGAPGESPLICKDGPVFRLRNGREQP
jgi:dihydroorotate dehydrogenase electron transfer subunit